ncbi:hypothetical protein [Caulobacter endophyticus]|uniref:General stress protein 17M-like domain-containing protein n=1 Tax=Caulobacter endophyticus TaxID=2172652 RepID=A0A2T9JXZ2_9CAUL|nr:hypothetical protein [Caulobacter endophyticus]PVM88585.1 hypothetical protein DDF67_13030 [Caulobacter endophyticus]
MTRTITRLFDTHAQALDAVEDLQRAGVDDDRISLVSNNADNWHAGDWRTGRSFSNGPLGDANRDGENDVAEGAGKGATTGGLIGGGAGLLAGLGMLAIPGLGPVVAAGWLASTAVGAAVGAVAGGATGGLLGALKEAGHDDAEANVYAEGVRRGGTLVSVRADEDRAGEIERILNGRRGVDAVSRGALYRQSGWSRFDESTDPYTVEQVRRERDLYRGEERSFAGGGDTEIAEDEQRRRETESRPGLTPGA